MNTISKIEPTKPLYPHGQTIDTVPISKQNKPFADDRRKDILYLVPHFSIFMLTFSRACAIML